LKVEVEREVRRRVEREELDEGGEVNVDEL